MKENLKENMEIYFMEENLPYMIKAISDRYAVCTRPLDRIEDEKLIKDEGYKSFESANKYPVYCLLDFLEMKRAPDNFYCKFNYAKLKECKKALKELISNEMELSRRNSISLNINWSKTLMDKV